MRGWQRRIQRQQLARHPLGVLLSHLLMGKVGMELMHKLRAWRAEAGSSEFRLGDWMDSYTPPAGFTNYLRLQEMVKEAVVQLHREKRIKAKRASALSDWRLVVLE